MFEFEGRNRSIIDLYGYFIVAEFFFGVDSRLAFFDFLFLSRDEGGLFLGLLLFTIFDYFEFDWVILIG